MNASYDSGLAKASALKRRRRGGRKLKPGNALWELTVKPFQSAWSLEQIAERLRVLHPMDLRERVSDNDLPDHLCAAQRRVKAIFAGLLMPSRAVATTGPPKFDT